MKAIEPYFPVVLFIMLCKMVLTFESVTKTYGVTAQMKSIEQKFSVALFVFSHLPKRSLGSVSSILILDSCGNEMVFLKKHFLVHRRGAAKAKTFLHCLQECGVIFFLYNSTLTTEMKTNYLNPN